MTKKISKFCLCACLIWTCYFLTGFSEKAIAETDSKAENELEIPMQNAQGKMIGRALLSQNSEGVKIRITVSGLKPGLHGIHFHEKGSCIGPDFSSAGAHFNPRGKQHGLANPQGYHAGDLRNLLVNKKGQANMELFSTAVTLDRDQPGSLIQAGGTSLVIHEQTDDMRTDPTGNSGSRIACGVVK
jgi:Cu-Zn family superoxide dismutase